MVENLQRIPANRLRSHGARLLAALNDKNLGRKSAGAGVTPAYRNTGQENSVLPFPVVVPPSPAVLAMPRRDCAGANRDSNTLRGTPDPYDLEDDREDDENSNPARSFRTGVTVGKRRVVGGSETQKQAHLPTLFSREQKRLQAARLVPAGMVNLGNTCYLNSVVQVLLNMASFTGDLRDPALERLAQHLPTAGVWAALRTTIDKLHMAMLARPTFESSKPAVEPSELRGAMGRRSSRWRSFSQQDAHEFLVELLEELQSEVLAAEAAATGRRCMPFLETRCPAARNLSGSLMHTWTCSSCGRCTRSKEPFSCLSLQLPAQGAVNLQDLFAEYLKDETIDKNCDGCSPSAPVAHAVQHHFWRLPRVLVVHIKRFMPLPQQQQLQQVPPRQGTLGGDAATPPVVSGAVRVEDAPEGAANPVNVPVTPYRDDSDGAGGPTAAADGVPDAPQPAGGASDSTAPAPYLYAKVHTVVKVAAGLDLARYCDAEARAHGHLLEVLSPDTFERRAGSEGDICAPSRARAAAVAGLATTTAAAGVGSAAAARAPAALTGCTLDTAGGGSTCPSPSFMQPNTSALQERTVQQQVSARPHRDHLRRSILGSSKAATPEGLRLLGPDSECGTSAISTGAQADGGDGAPTPYGGCDASASRLPRSLGRKATQMGVRSPLGGGDNGLTSARKVQGATCAGQAGDPTAGLGSMPQPQLRPGTRERGLGSEVCQPTPMDVSTGDGLSSHTGSDRLGPMAPPNCTGHSGGGGGGGGGNVAAFSGRKAPRPMCTGAFFETGAAAEARSDEGGGDCGGSGAIVRQPDGEAAARPVKRICLDGMAATPLGRPSAEPPRPAPTPVVAQRLDEMTEEEQFQLALQMSLAEEGVKPVSCGCGGGDVVRPRQSSVAGPAANTPGAAAGSGPVAPGRGDAALDLSLPTAAATVRPDCSGRCPGLVCNSGGSAGGVRVAEKSAAQHAGAGNGGEEDEEGCDNEELMIELQDESQGGCGAAHRGEDGQGPRGGGRASSASPAMSGASGGKKDGDESDCSAGQALLGTSGGGISPFAGCIERRRSRKRRVAKLFDHEDMPDVAESPAVPPLRQLRRQAGSAVAAEGRVHGGLPVAYSIDDEDDGTTALSPVSGGAGKRPTLACTSGGEGAGAVAAEERGTAADDDAALEEAKRLSLQTFAAEEEGRRFCSSGGEPGPGRFAYTRKSRAEMEWERMMTLPEPNDAVGAAAEQAAPAEKPNCKTPPRGRGGGSGGPAASGASGGTDVAPPPLVRRRSAPSAALGDCLCNLASGDEDGGRGRGIDALVAAAGLNGGVHTHGASAAACAAVTAHRPESLQRQNSTGAGTTTEQFKFGFSLPGGADGAGTAAGGQGLDLGPAGSRREDPLDLTGGDDEDQDLAKAIMLSLQDVHPQNNVIGDAAGGDAVPYAAMDLAGAHGADGDDVETQPDKPKVVLVPDSDYEEGIDDDDEEDKNGGGGSGGVAPAGAGAAVAANGSRSAAAPADNDPWATHGSNRMGRRAHKKGEAAAGVPLALVARYRLHGVVRHKGLTPFSGHYVADVLVPSSTTGQMWYEHNDAVVSHVDFDRVREDAAKQGYMFFFVNAPRQVSALAMAAAAAAATPLPDDLAGDRAEEAAAA